MNSIIVFVSCDQWGHEHHMLMKPAKTTRPTVDHSTAVNQCAGYKSCWNTSICLSSPQLPFTVPSYRNNEVQWLCRCPSSLLYSAGIWSDTQSLLHFRISNEAPSVKRKDPANLLVYRTSRGEGEKKPIQTQVIGFPRNENFIFEQNLLIMSVLAQELLTRLHTSIYSHDNAVPFRFFGGKTAFYLQDK